MVELRWAIPEHTTTKAPRLQYRLAPAVVTLGCSGWSEWQDVPWVVVSEAPLKPAPTALSALGVVVPEASGWIKMTERRPERGQLIVKRWLPSGSVWAGIYAATDKDSSFDEWVALPAAGVPVVQGGQDDRS